MPNEIMIVGGLIGLMISVLIFAAFYITDKDHYKYYIIILFMLIILIKGIYTLGVKI